MHNDIKVVIFDLGRVLIPIDVHYLLGRASELLSIPQGDIATAWRDNLEDLTLGRLSVAKFYDDLAQAHDVQLKMPANQVVEDLYIYFEKAQIGEEMLHLIQKLQKRYTVVILTNAEVETGKIFTQGKIANAVDHVYASSQLQMRKPDREIYEYVCDDLAVIPQECFFIDDLEENEIGAQKAGMHATVYIDYETLVRDLKKMNLLTSDT